MEIKDKAVIPKMTTTAEMRGKILDVEAAISQLPGAMFNDCFPLRHSFGDGLYVREITVPAGMLVITKIHKKAHPYFVLKGDVSVLTEDGVKRIQAPFSGMTPAGTKRVCYCHTEVVWTTVHATEETDLVKIEEEIISKTFDDVLPDAERLKFLLGAEVTI